MMTLIFEPLDILEDSASTDNCLLVDRDQQHLDEWNSTSDDGSEISLLNNFFKYIDLKAHDPFHPDNINEDKI